ncbi:MAG: hypothetical protein UY26_C0002G0115 [Candidatus Jorgensenbacteria bacterium GW2011_GWA1_48_13]|uniref:Uncharacterized protein n=2 Tax=Candidatus Joergenseniibacteriota TaxID=1752739 RepID=A0A0G1W9B6_9BACT|nr:MAG: hypothetical protein UY26_C0002G0115 [Candidatus Jorgensenbacteria bacterium GW2011_GWA1_48_13]KKU98523.1 MAG: hypothetical protein UY32_C0025G0008 [Candidatus Jorgensenbacteria bacterium GW2011_GWC1_48_8]KKW15396.1 MAG: hypothetical protein UY55_C0001G0150 [Candidatus Jorgensenbacteria bacterium GW2011_GWB1_50_10]
MKAVATAKPQAYTPRFPEMYKFLFEVYSRAMKPGAKDAEVWCERAKTLFLTLSTLKEEGVLPISFTQTFWEDVQAVMKTVHGRVKPVELTETQSYLTFGISNLRRDFGGD